MGIFARGCRPSKSVREVQETNEKEIRLKRSGFLFPK
jgi:hypothetical protein